MLGDLRATLYDLFGYLIPGVVALCAAFLAASAFDVAHLGPLFPEIVRSYQEGFLLLAAYLAGHGIHALGNALPPFTRSAEQEQLASGGIPKDLVSRARALLSTRLACDCSDLPVRDVYELLDEGRVLHDSEGDREMYIYREGFYRGMAVASSLLALTSLLALAFRPACSTLDTPAIAGCLPRAGVLLTLVASTAASLGFFARMCRFSDYRVRRAVYRFLIANDQPSGAKEAK